jgi:hypothetical protein
MTAQARPAVSSASALAAAMTAEHEAIFGYGVVGAHLDRTGQDAARAAEAAHRARRDTVALRLTASSATPPAAQPAYTLPFAVTNRDGALRLAIVLEEHTAQAWRRALAETAGDDRRLAVEALMDCAAQATRWRRFAGVTPSTVPFPGAPG